MRTEWSNDLDELSAFHTAVEAQIAAWNCLFPVRIYKIDLLKPRADRKDEINRLLDFCGLGWSEAPAEARSKPQIGDWPIERLVHNREAHATVWRAARPLLTLSSSSGKLAFTGLNRWFPWLC